MITFRMSIKAMNSISTQPHFVFDGGRTMQESTDYLSDSDSKKTINNTQMVTITNAFTSERTAQLLEIFALLEKYRYQLPTFTYGSNSDIKLLNWDVTYTDEHLKNLKSIILSNDKLCVELKQDSNVLAWVCKEHSYSKYDTFLGKPDLVNADLVEVKSNIQNAILIQLAQQEKDNNTPPNTNNDYIQSVTKQYKLNQAKNAQNKHWLKNEKMWITILLLSIAIILAYIFYPKKPSIKEQNKSTKHRL